MHSTLHMHDMRIYIYILLHDNMSTAITVARSTNCSPDQHIFKKHVYVYFQH